MPKGTFCSDRFYGLSGENINTTLIACLNSTYASLSVEVNGYHVNHGGIDTSTWWLQTLPVLSERNPELEEIYQYIRKRAIELARIEHSLTDRRELDKAFFKILGLPFSAIDDMYEQTQTMITGRIFKAERKLTKGMNKA
jgi:hypothetical protein